LKVGIFVGGGDARAGGGHAVVKAVVNGLSRVSTAHEITIIHSGFDELPETPGLEVRRIVDHSPRSFARRLGDKLRRRVPPRELDALGLEFIWFLTPATAPARVPFAMTVWDLAHRTLPFFPEVSTSGWSWDEREAHYRRWLPRAAYVVTGASAGADDLQRCYGVSPARIRVLPLVAPELPTSTQQSGPSAGKEPYVFYPAQFWPHKNHVGLLHAMKLLRERHGVRLRLVLSGSDKGNLQYVQSVVRELGMSADVDFEGFVSPTRLADLYRCATALVFPSYFGPDNLPPLEAFSVGCPVIAADVPGASEQLGDAAILVDPSDDAAMAAAIARVACDAELRDLLRARGHERAKRWTATDYAAGMLRIIDEFARERRCWSPDVPYVHA
jgi:glycosyltransferase involved in cell wall biosynthesis